MAYKDKRDIALEIGFLLALVTVICISIRARYCASSFPVLKKDICRSLFEEFCGSKTSNSPSRYLRNGERDKARGIFDFTKVWIPSPLNLCSRWDCYLARAKIWQRNCEAVRRMGRRRFEIPPARKPSYGFLNGLITERGRKFLIGWEKNTSIKRFWRAYMSPMGNVSNHNISKLCCFLRDVALMSTIEQG